MTQSLATNLNTSFRQATIDVAGELRTSLSRLVGFDAGGARKSRDAQKRFGIDFQLSWQIYRIVNSSNPLELCPSIPLPPAMQRLYVAARRHGVPDRDIVAVESAYAKFEELVEHFAGDRGSFDSMVTRLIGGETDTQAEIPHRRSIFDGQRYILGVELDTNLTADIFHPSKAGDGGYDYAGLRVKRHFRRLSSDAPLVIERRRVRDMGDQNPPVAAVPLDAEAMAQYGIPILPAFCSTSRLMLQSKEERDGTMVTKWIGGAVGRPSEIDIALGEVFRNVTLRERPNGKCGFTGSTTFTTPTRLFIRDLILPRSVFGPPECNVTRWSHAVEFPKRVEPVEEISLPKLTCTDRFSYVGSGSSAFHAVEVPQYADMLKFVCNSQGWDLDGMDVYRIRIEYPLMFTLLAMAFTFEFNQRTELSLQAI